MQGFRVFTPHLFIHLLIFSCIQFFHKYLLVLLCAMYYALRKGKNNIQLLYLMNHVLVEKTKHKQKSKGCVKYIKRLWKDTVMEQKEGD
jgi:hypothetical protein